MGHGVGDGALPGFAQVDLEQDYEQKLRKKQKQEKNRLLVKREDKWVVDDRQQDQEQNESEDEKILVEAQDSCVANPDPKPAPKKPKLPPKEEIRLAKEELARMASLVSEGPEEHIGLLHSLAEYAGSENLTVKKLALGTQLAVYKDIIPGYRIRPLSRDDLQAKLSKDVRKLRNFEHALVGGYKDYVLVLDTLSKDSKGTDPGVWSVAISCACALLTSVPHFNCRNDLIAIMVRKLSSRTVDVGFAQCQEALQTMFRDDDEGHASLEAVKQLTTMMKTKDYRIDENALNTFLHLRLLSEFSRKGSTTRIDKEEPEEESKPLKKRNKKEFRTKREKKVMRERKEIEKEMKDADAAVSYEERDGNQAETLKLVFIAYLRILKIRAQHLMGAVLEGLAKYAHLINQDFFGDILVALQDLINEATASLHDEESTDEEVDFISTRNATRESLLCIITAFALLQGQIDVTKSASALHLDLSSFITHLYRSLLPLAMDQDIELGSKLTHLTDPNGLPIPMSVSKDTKVNVSTTTVLLLRSLQAVLLPPTATKMVPPVRIAAFVKQLQTAALHLPQKSAVAVMGLLNQVCKVHGKKIAALWYTEERKGDGVFDPLSAEVEASNPFAGTVWEGELLRLHFDPRVREGVKGVEGSVVELR